ncbi:type II toxin-antitoxin system VapB family antitoxin [Actinomycetospora endophytica]|uniref:Type II toxin-antitoxin system VapB family antitoxin n=1 Tax=Actinomycetospora endophytica TaxID=2291215 RepID=A0ABS8PFQ9_9PSEU|nr:type II toxin-antitoxin system VapB family antitoxin [Actinomycetospora endophytica]MCD2196999.1 type II toxin-antitoxin system VapB family antitoxin [Actinomycetospora endophytica]
MAALNIKNDETYALARELADETGESLTEAVTTAVRERLARLKLRDTDDVEERGRVGWAIATDMAARWGRYDPDVDPTAFLYDEETGLPQ